MYHYVLSTIKSIFNRELSDEVLLENGDLSELNNLIDGQSSIQAPDQALGPVHVPDNRQRSDTYANVVFRINDRWRIIVCPEGVQWILQKRKGNLVGSPAWNAVKFCRSKVGLCRALKEEVGDVSPEVDAQLAQLPDWVES
ncbi:MAG: hypothetical protein E5X07_15760 [Mesorhizobium sp.]|nr:MAG: hypothetical protein E5X07_15760 [Mesorhizobium sp.]